MKKTKFFLLGLAALSLAACNKDNGVEPIVETDATVSFVIKTGEGRAVGDGLADAKITKLTAMVYSGQVQEALKTVEDANGVTKVEGITCKSGANRKLVVIANHNYTLDGKSYNEVMALTTELVAANQSAQGLVMTGESATFTIKPGANHYGYPTGTTSDNLISEGSPLAVTRVHAGMSFSGVTVNMATQYENYYSFKTDDAKIAALVAKKDSKIFGSSLVTDTKAYLFGVATPAGLYTPDATGESYTEETSLKSDYAVGAGFYVLESKYDVTNELRPTILCIYGKLLDKNGDPLIGQALQDAIDAGFCNNEGITYYPVLVNYNGNGYTYTGHTAENKIVRNNHYKIALTIKGPGTDTPENPQPAQANLNVNCTVTPWVVVGQTATWN
ncbi:fimbrial protein [Porphyromonas loveana]|uniref:fimbrial protein n=1 Tax=Porphyromonas loveana TaxID=1884669 RepID=UPI0035A18DC6